MTRSDPDPIHHPHQRLVSEAVLKDSWRLWMALLAGLLALFFAAIWAGFHHNRAAIPDTFANVWALVAGLFMIVAVPLSFLVRRGFLRRYWEGHNYLKAMGAVWVTIAVGCIISFSGSIITGFLFPELLPGGVGLILFCLLWPTGKPMIASDHGLVDETPHPAPPRSA